MPLSRGEVKRFGFIVFESNGENMQGRDSERPNHTHRQTYAAIAHMLTIICSNGAEKNVNICGIHLHRLQQFVCRGSWGLTGEIKEGKRREIEMSEKEAHSIDGTRISPSCLPRVILFIVIMCSSLRILFSLAFLSILFLREAQ